jgi:hypothetical protein
MVLNPKTAELEGKKGFAVEEWSRPLRAMLLILGKVRFK